MLRYNAIKRHGRPPFEGHGLIRPGRPRTLGRIAYRRRALTYPTQTLSYRPISGVSSVPLDSRVSALALVGLPMGCITINYVFTLVN